MPKYLYEAAAIDRVSGWRHFWTITFPYIRGLLMLALLFRTIEAFKLFDLVVPADQGRPRHLDRDDRRLRLSASPSSISRPARVAALAYILLFIVIVLTNLYLYLANRRAQEA